MGAKKKAETKSNDKKDSGAKGAKGAKGKDDKKDDAKDTKVKGAQAVIVRHILVGYNSSSDFRMSLYVHCSVKNMAKRKKLWLRLEIILPWTISLPWLRFIARIRQSKV